MPKLGFVFAGQGQQFSYMGRDLVEMYPLAKEKYERASNLLGRDVLNMDLNTAQSIQIGLFVLACVLDDLLKESDIHPDVVCGLSLGEFGALYSSGVISFEDGLKIISKRSQLMQDAFEPNTTKMAACIRTDRETIEALISDFEVEICNVNTPTQIVIGGKSDAVDKAIGYLKEHKIRAIPLNVPTVSHMSLLKNETDVLRDYLFNFNFNKPNIGFINNIEAKLQEDHFEDSLSRQISETTELYESIRLMIEMGVKSMIEVGPKGAISKFVKEIDPSVTIYNVYDVDTLKEIQHG